MSRLSIAFISQGGAPWLWLTNIRSMLKLLEVSLARIPEGIGEERKTVCMISGHREDRSFAVMTSARSGMVDGCGGFPPESHKIVYAKVCNAQEDHLVPLSAALSAAEEEVAAMVHHDANAFGAVTASSQKIG